MQNDIQQRSGQNYALNRHSISRKFMTMSNKQNVTIQHQTAKNCERLNLSVIATSIVACCNIYSNDVSVGP